MHKALVLTVSLIFLAACAPFIPVTKIADLPPEKQSALKAIKVYEPSERSGGSYDVIGDLTGNSCKNLMWEPSPSRDDAIDQMRHLASERGANGITDIKCEQPRGTSFATNCWESLTCTAKAIKVKGR